MDTARWSDAPAQGSGTATDLRAAAPVQEPPARRATLRGLIALGVIVLLFSVLRAGVSRAFVPGWWAEW